MQHKSLFKKYFISSLLFFVGSFIGFFLLLHVHNTFQIQNVEVIGVSREKYALFLILFKGISTLTLQPEEINKMVHLRFPTIIVKESHVKFPNTLVLVVEEEKPLAYLKTDYGYMALSKNGIVIMKDRSSEIPHPLINFYQVVHHSEYQTGQYIRFTTIKKALIFITLLMDEGYTTETVAIDSVDMIACKTRGFEVVFSQSRSLESQSYEVRQIIRQIKVGALSIEHLDLRFDKPVVQLQKK